MAVKAVGRGLVHKSEQGAVRLGLEAPAAVEAAARALLPLGECLLVEGMVGDGVAEVIVGVDRDPQVGLVLVIGSGGVLAELVGDRVVLLAPRHARRSSPPFPDSGPRPSLQDFAAGRRATGRRSWTRSSPSSDSPSITPTACSSWT